MNLVDSLCSHEDSVVAYRARQLLAGESEQSPAMHRLRRSIGTTKMAQRLLKGLCTERFNPSSLVSSHGGQTSAERRQVRGRVPADAPAALAQTGWRADRIRVGRPRRKGALPDPVLRCPQRAGGNSRAGPCERPTVPGRHRSAREQGPCGWDAACRVDQREASKRDRDARDLRGLGADTQEEGQPLGDNRYALCAA